MGRVPPKPPVVLARPQHIPQTWEPEFPAFMAETRARLWRHDPAAAADLARSSAASAHRLSYAEFQYLDDPADIEDWAKILVHRRAMRMRRRYSLWLVAMCAFSFLVLLVCVVAIWR